MISTVLINGEVSEGGVPVTDSSVLRGDGCFEVLKAYSGRAFAVDDHLERLASSAAKLEIDLPSRSDLRVWIGKVVDEVPEGAVRIVVTRGSSVAGVDGAPLVIVFGHPMESPREPSRLHPVTAPWHASGVDWALAGAKVTSYAANMSMTRVARAAGFEDALLVTTDNLILEGPTFSVAWVVDGILETPTLDLGILDSITRRKVMELSVGVDVIEGKWALPRLDEASEVMAWSTIREVQAVVAVGHRVFEPGPVTERLAAGFAGLVAG